MKLQALQEVKYVGEKNWYVSFAVAGRAAEKVRDIGIARSPDEALKLMAQDSIDNNELDEEELDYEKALNDFRKEAYDFKGEIIVFVNDEFFYVAKRDRYIEDEDI